MNSKRKVIWSDVIKTSDWILKDKESMAKEYPEFCTPVGHCKGIRCENCLALFDFLSKILTIDNIYEKFNVKISAPIVALKTIKTRQGIKYEYEMLGVHLSNIFNIKGEKSVYYTDSYNVYAEFSNSDSTEMILYRKLKSGITAYDIMKMVLKNENKCHLTSLQISRYTTSLLPDVKRI